MAEYLNRNTPKFLTLTIAYNLALYYVFDQFMFSVCVVATGGNIKARFFASALGSSTTFWLTNRRPEDNAIIDRALSLMTPQYGRRQDKRYGHPD
ncbi:glycoside hydrolase family 16 protein [Moniliophthora roreri]|nr:glycoside hydrolase family 16 protein [Moniliophthora roreri]